MDLGQIFASRPKIRYNISMSKNKAFLKFRTVADVLRQMKETHDLDEIMAYENELSFDFAFPIIFGGGIANTIGRTLFFKEPISVVMVDSFFLFFLALIFYLTSKIKNKPRVQSNLYTSLYIGIFLLVVVRYYDFAGPSVWSYGMVLIMISMLHLRRTMLTALGISILGAGSLIAYQNPQYTIDWLYYVNQFVAFTALFFISGTVHKILKDRYDLALRQYEQINVSASLWHQTLEAVGDGVLSLDSSGHINYLNETAASFVNKPIEEVIGQELQEVITLTIDDEAFDLSDLNPNKFRSLDKHLKQYVLHNNVGEEMNVEMMFDAIQGIENQVVGAVMVIRDLSIKTEERRHIEYISYHDPLTGIYNRRYFEEEIRRIDTHRQLPISVIYVDVNSLKTINDAFGHEEGDELIKRVALILHGLCRQEEVVARLGGDEFAVLLPNTSLEMAEAMIDRFTEAIRDEKLREIPISASFGTAVKETLMEDIQSTIKTAEDNMYRNKRLQSKENRSTGIDLIMKALWEKSKVEEQHSFNVRRLARKIGDHMDLDQSIIEDLALAAVYHDIGKIRVEREILEKKASLVAEEWEKAKNHSETGYRLLSTSMEHIPVAEAVRHHHENWNGSGYPEGLSGSHIPLISRIIRVADSYDVLVTGRPYKVSVEPMEALDEIKALSGISYDPGVVHIFESMFDDEVSLDLKVSDLA